MKLTLQEAKDRFAATGECNHDEAYCSDIEPFECNVSIHTCTVCAEEISRRYLVNNNS